jgi:hypothetical protein
LHRAAGRWRKGERVIGTGPRQSSGRRTIDTQVGRIDIRHGFAEDDVQLREVCHSTPGRRIDRPHHRRNAFGERATEFRIDAEVIIRELEVEGLDRDDVRANDKIDRALVMSMTVTKGSRLFAAVIV